MDGELIEAATAAKEESHPSLSRIELYRRCGDLMWHRHAIRRTFSNGAPRIARAPQRAYTPSIIKSWVDAHANLPAPGKVDRESRCGSSEGNEAGSVDPPFWRVFLLRITSLNLTTQSLRSRRSEASGLRSMPMRLKAFRRFDFTPCRWAKPCPGGTFRAD